MYWGYNPACRARIEKIAKLTVLGYTTRYMVTPFEYSLHMMKRTQLFGSHLIKPKSHVFPPANRYSDGVGCSAFDTTSFAKASVGIVSGV